MALCCAAALLAPGAASAGLRGTEAPYRLSLWVMPVATALHAVRGTGVALPVGVNVAPAGYTEVMVETTFLWADYPLSVERDDLKHTRGLIVAAGPVFRFESRALRGWMFVFTPKLQVASLRTAFSGQTFNGLGAPRQPVDQDPQYFAHGAVDLGVEWTGANFSVALLGGMGVGYCLACRSNYFDPYGVLDVRPVWSRADGPNISLNTNVLRVGAAF